MTEDIHKRIELQNAEFDALTDLSQKWEMLRRVPVIDDDYPEYPSSV